MGKLGHVVQIRVCSLTKTWFVHSDSYTTSRAWYMISISEFRPESDSNWQDLRIRHDHIYNVKIHDHNILWLFLFIFSENFYGFVVFSFSLMYPSLIVRTAAAKTILALTEELATRPVTSLGNVSRVNAVRMLQGSSVKLVRSTRPVELAGVGEAHLLIGSSRSLSFIWLSSSKINRTKDFLDLWPTRHFRDDKGTGTEMCPAVTVIWASLRFGHPHSKNPS